MSFKDLKKQSSLGSLTSKLVKEVEKMNNTGGNSDDRLWKPEMDKSGNGYAVIRFLPAPDGEDLTVRVNPYYRITRVVNLHGAS